MPETINRNERSESAKNETTLNRLRRWAKDAENSRIKQEVLWYEIQLYKDGDHYVVVPDRERSSGGTIRIQPLSRRKGEVRRVFNKFRSIFRALKATTSGTEIRYEVPGGSEEEIMASNYLNWYIDKEIGFHDTVKDVLEYGFLRSVGYFDVYWDSTMVKPVVKDRDPFDLLMDKHGKYARRTYTMRVQDFQELKDSEGDKIFKNTNELIPTKKRSSSDVYDNYLRNKYESGSGKGNTDEIMVEEFHELIQKDDGKFEIKVTTTTEGSDKINAEETYEDDELRFVPYWPERRPNDIYNEPWMKDALDPQKSLDSIYTHFEEFIRTMGKGRILKRKGVMLDRISDKDGQIIEWDGEKPEFVDPRAMTGDQFNFDNKVERNLEDVVGIHPSQIRQTTTAKGIGYLIAQDETNISDPFTNLQTALLKVGRKLLKLSTRHMMSSQEIFWFIDGQKQVGRVIGQSPSVGAPEGVVELQDIDSLTVDLLPRGAFAALLREEKIMQLVNAGVLTNPEVIMEGMNIGNVRELVEKEMKFRTENPQQAVQGQVRGQQQGNGVPQSPEEQSLNEAMQDLRGLI